MKPTLSVFIGDGHGGSDMGLCIPGYMLGGANKEKKRPYSASLQQVKLHKEFQRMEKDIKAMAKGHRLCLKLGGDWIDGVNHHGTTETTGNVTNETDMMVELLEPLVMLAEEVHGVTGTESHVGSKGDGDSIVYSKLKVPYDSKWNLVEDGKRLWWAHHGVKVGAREWTLDNPAATLAKDVEMRCLRLKIARPDLIVGHHAHRTIQPVSMRGITVAVCPCWQLSTYYGDSFSPHTDPDIGIITWKPSTNETKVIPYYC